MGETTPPPDDRFPKVFSMTSATYQPAGARGGFAKQPKEEEAEGPMEDKEGCGNETGDSAVGKATETAEAAGDSAKSVKANADTAGATVKDEAVINEAAAAGAEERGGAELEQGCCYAIAIVADHTSL